MNKNNSSRKTKSRNKSKNRSITRSITKKHTHVSKINKTDNIKILSYNISWESMSGAKKDWALCSNDTNPKNPKHSSVCVSNIAQVINNNLTDFITLQEAADYKKLLDECPRLNKMKYKVHKSGLDVVITFWDTKYKMVDSFEGEFERGRPWMAIMFNNGLCLINVHFGHYDSNEEYEKLENIIKIITARMPTTQKINRFIIGGDFNYDIKDFGDKKGIINLDGHRFYHHPKHMLTCCVSRRRHYDHVIDTYRAPIDIVIPDVEYMASDHKPIMAILHKLKS